MQITNSLNFYFQRKRDLAAKVRKKTPKPPKLDQALKLVAEKLIPYAITLTNNLSDAEDLCQHTLLKPVSYTHLTLPTILLV